MLTHWGKGFFHCQHYASYQPVFFEDFPVGQPLNPPFEGPGPPFEGPGLPFEGPGPPFEGPGPPFEGPPFENLPFEGPPFEGPPFEGPFGWLRKHIMSQVRETSRSIIKYSI